MDINALKKLKNNVLRPHLDFVESMLMKVQGSNFEGSWLKMQNCIRDDKKIMTKEQISKMNQTIMSLREKQQPFRETYDSQKYSNRPYSNSSHRNRSPDRTSNEPFQSTSSFDPRNNRSNSRDPRQQNRDLRVASRENFRKVESPEFEIVPTSGYLDDYRRQAEVAHHSRHRSRSPNHFKRSRSPNHSRVFQESRSKSREFSKYSREYRERFDAPETSRSSDPSVSSRSPTRFSSYREQMRPMRVSPERRRNHERAQSHRRDRMELEIEYDDAAFTKDYEGSRKMPPRRMSVHHNRHPESNRNSQSLNYHHSGYSSPSMNYQPEAESFQNEFQKFPVCRTSVQQNRVETITRPPPQRRKSTFIENPVKDGSMHPRFEEARKKLIGNVNSQSSEVKISPTVMKIKEFAEKVLPNEEKAENLVKNLEEALGREAFLKIKSLLTGGDGNKKEETKTLDSVEKNEVHESFEITEVPTKVKIASETSSVEQLLGTQKIISKAERIIANSYQNSKSLPEKQKIEFVQSPSKASSKSSENPSTVDEYSNDTSKHKIGKTSFSTASHSKPFYTIPKKSRTAQVAKPLEIPTEKKTGSMSKLSKDRKSVVDSKLTEMQTKQVNRKSLKVDHRSNSEDKCSKTALPAASTSSKSKPSIPSKSTESSKNSKPTIPPQPKRKLTELDRLLLDIDESFMRDEISGGFQKRQCTVVSYKEDTFVKYQEYDLKKFSLKLMKLDLSNEEMPVVLDRQFLERHPSVKDALRFEDLKEVEEEVQEEVQELQRTKENTGKKTQVLQVARENTEKEVQKPPENVGKQKPKMSHQKTAALTRKRAAWSRGVIKKKAKKPKLDFAEDEWEDIEDDELEGETMKMSDFIGAVDSLIPQPKSATVHLIANDIVHDFSFTVCRAGKLKKCRVCNFESVDNENFLSHVQSSHQLLKWNRYCKKCDAVVENVGETLEDEFQHLLKHLGEDPKLSLKIRTLPGDKLSTVSKSVINLPDPGASKRLEVLTGTATMIQRSTVDHKPISEGKESQLQNLLASSPAAVEDNVANKETEEENLLVEVESERSSSEGSSSSSSSSSGSLASYNSIEAKKIRQSQTVEKLKERLDFLKQKLSVPPNIKVKPPKKIKSKSSEKTIEVRVDTPQVTDAAESPRTKAHNIPIASLLKKVSLINPVRKVLLAANPFHVTPFQNTTTKSTVVTIRGVTPFHSKQFTPISSPSFLQVTPSNTSGFKQVTPTTLSRNIQATPSTSCYKLMPPLTSIYKQDTPSTSGHEQAMPSTSSCKQSTPSTSSYKHATAQLSNLLKTKEPPRSPATRTVTSRLRSVPSKGTENVVQLQSKSTKVPVVIKIPRYAFDPKHNVSPHMSSTGTTVSYHKEIELVSISTLRPWLLNTDMEKSCNLCAEMLSTECLAALFKCMGTNCSFYSSDKSVFAKHLDLHEYHESHDAKCYLACAYCNIVTGNTAALIAHVVDFHGESNFQCSYCFFRSFNDFHVFFHHRNSCHNSKPRKIIEIAPTIPKETRLVAMARIRKRLHLTVPQIICAYCNAGFYVFASFVSHLDEHRESMLAKCSKCLAPTNKMTIIRHLFECFNFGGLQCVHCRFGTNDFKVIEEHLADKHYNKPAVFCERPKIIKGDSNELARLSLKEIRKAAPNVDRIVFYHHDMLKNESYIDCFIKSTADHDDDDSQFSELIEKDGEDSDSDDVQIIEQETVIVDLDDYEETEKATEVMQDKEINSLTLATLEAKNSATTDADDSCLHMDVPGELQKESTPLKTQENGKVEEIVTPEVHPDPKTRQEQPKIHLADQESCSEFQQVYPDFPAASEVSQQDVVIEELNDPIATANSEEIKVEQPTDPLSTSTAASVVESTVALNPESKNVDDFSPLNIGNVVSLFQTFRGEDDDSLEGIELFDFDSV